MIHLLSVLHRGSWSFRPFKSPCRLHPPKIRDGQIFYDLAEKRRGLEPYRSRRLRVRAEFDRERAVFEIADEGPGFDHRRLHRPVQPEDLSRVGGRGLLLMRTFMDEIAYNDRGNVVSLTKRFSGTPKPAAAPTCGPPPGVIK